MTRAIMSLSRASLMANGPALAVPVCSSRCTSTPPASGLTIQLKPRSATTGDGPPGFLARSIALNICSSSVLTSASVHASASAVTPVIFSVTAPDAPRTHTSTSLMLLSLHFSSGRLRTPG